MSSPPRQRAAAGLFLALALCAGIPGRAGAQSTEEAGDEAVYRRTIRSAVAELAAGRHAEALALFREAHRIAPSARTLRGIAMASFEVGDYVTAVRYAERALASDVRPLPADLRAQTRALSRRASAFVARYELELSPADATVRLDGVQTHLEAGGVLLVSLGRHTVRAEAPGHEPVEEVVLVRGGERERLVLRLPAVGEPETGSPQPVVERPPEPAPPDHTAAHVIVGVAAVTGAGAIGTWGWYVNRVDAVSDCDGRCENLEVLADQRDASLITSVALTSTAVALGVVGALVWLLGESDAGEAGAEASACGAAPAGVACAFPGL